MEIKEFLELLGKKKQTILSILLLFVLLTGVLTFIQPFRYEAKSRILLLQHNGEATDPYNAAKTSQFVSNLLVSVVPSNVFFADVFQSGFDIDQSYFGDTAKKRLKKWQKTVEASAINDTGIIEISAFHTDKNQAKTINEAVINIIKTKSGSYYGRNEDISIKIIDEPILSDWPVRPNILLNFSLTILISLLISFSYISLFPESAYDLHILPRKKVKQRIVDEKNIYHRVEENKNTQRMSNAEFTPMSRINSFDERGDINNIFDQSNTK